MMIYDRYKPSKTPWMGEVPEHWKLEKAKWHFTLRNERGNENPVLLAATQKNGMYPQDKVEGVVKVAEGTDMQQFRTVHKNDFVISLRSFQGGFERSDYEGVCSPAYQVFYSDEAWNDDYLRYLFKNELFIDAMNALTVGIREGRNIKYEDFANSILAIPPIKEQEGIAAYLDKKVGYIDFIISEAKASIEEYKFWKASIIYETVTKGMNPDVEMKDSGIKWIGKMPVDWKRTKLENCFRVIGSGTTPTSNDNLYYDGTINWLQSGDINGGIVTSTKRHISDIAYNKFSALKIYEAPFIAVAMYGASIANTSIVEIPACTNQACCVLCSAGDFVDMRYIFFAILGAKEELLLSARGGTQPNINQDILKKLRIPIPPKTEQKRIALFLASYCKKIDMLIEEKESLITDLEAYKKSLIFEVVTGKRRVV